MSKAKLFEEESDEEVAIKTENEYAKKYDKWREKEELHKLEQKYGTAKTLSSDASVSSDSEDEDEEPPEISEEVEEQFLKTLALLKTKDPRIYDPNYKFFDESTEKIDENKPKEKTLTFDDSDSEDDNDGNIFTVEKKAEVQQEPKQYVDKNEKKPVKGKQGKLKDYLTGKAKHIDTEVEKDLAPLKALWSDPKISEGEAFLRDYILNKRYMDGGEGPSNAGAAEERLHDDEALSEDERRVEEQGQFERAYNFRFEEPDQEFVKRFPRTMSTVRPKDDRRARARAEAKARKAEEKKRQMEEIGRLKALKLKDIQEKLAKIKEVTGNEELAFKDEDIEGDFDPAEHDRRMQAIFDEQYYGDAKDHKKPVFPELDEELGIENWEKYEPNQERETSQGGEGPHCEDENFNMDADYNPASAREQLLEKITQTLGKRRNRKKKTKLAALLAAGETKDVPDLTDKTYEQYMDEYYALDFEDVIGGDLRTRFKYRDCEANDYGLSVEEILLADDKELTQWVPLKRVLKPRAAAAERSVAAAFRQRAQDERLKKKILPSLFKELPEEPEMVGPVEEATKKKKKKKKKNKQKAKEETTNNAGEDAEQEDESSIANEDNNTTSSETIGKKKKRKEKHEAKENGHEVLTEDISTGNAEEPQSKKKKKRKISNNEFDQQYEGDTAEAGPSKRAKKDDNVHNLVNGNCTDKVTQESGNDKRKKKKLKEKDDNPVEPLEESSHLDSSVEKADQEKKNKDAPIELDKTNFKRKGNANDSQVVKKKKNKNKKSNVPGSKTQNSNFKHKNQSKNNNQSQGKPTNPLINLSDERLKAYGLNPKKYKNFLKYKKF